MTVRLAGGEVEHVELRIFEPPRFFEALLRGRGFTEAPDITARICGICPVAYQTSSINAMEQLCGIEIPEPIRMLRRLLYCGEWIESHALHVYMLHAPDFLGYDGAVELARDAPAAVERGLALKKTGNALMTLIGGREIHPINVRVGGFYRAPTRADLAPVEEQLTAALYLALATVRWVAGFDFPSLELDHELLAVHEDDRYAITRGRLISSGGLDFPVSEFPSHVVERQVPHSTALHAALNGRRYLTGPLARYSLNHAQLSPLALQAAAELGSSVLIRAGGRALMPWQRIVEERA